MNNKLGQRVPGKSPDAGVDDLYSVYNAALDAIHSGYHMFLYQQIVGGFNQQMWNFSINMEGASSWNTGKRNW